MDAVILVGGGGTRLRPLTNAVPKPLIPVLNKPLIAHLIANLARHGVENVVLAASATEKRIEAALGEGYGLGVHIAYAYEEEPLGSGLAVKAAAKDFQGPFFVCNGDVITDLDLSSMTQRHREGGATLSISLSSVEDPSGYGVVEMTDGDRITRFVEKPARGEAPSSWANAGTWIFEPEVLDHIPDERMDGSLERLVFPSLIADGFMELRHAPRLVRLLEAGGRVVVVAGQISALRLIERRLRGLPFGALRVGAIGGGQECQRERKDERKIIDTA